jgi:hypothetical protein
MQQPQENESLHQHCDASRRPDTHLSDTRRTSRLLCWPVRLSGTENRHKAMQTALVQFFNLAEAGLCVGCSSCGEYGIPDGGRGLQRVTTMY